MIEITVRTLDSQNHKFSVADEYSVLEFKQHIASTVNIPAETQRIIYCGRVLSDEAKLVDLDVNGKVVHLVERPPPSENQNEQQNRAPNMPQMPSTQARMLGGNAMYLGSMAFEPQNLVPPPPTFRLAASRLNVARRMLRRAEATITLLENPSARPPSNPPNDDVQVEVTPVFEARVIVPATSGENISQNLMNAVHSSLSNAANMPQPNQSTDNSTTQEASADTETTASAGSTPEAASTPISTSTEDLSSHPTTNNQGTNTPGQENVSRTSEMAELLETLGRLQTRFAPYLQRYQNFLQEDPVVESDDLRSMDRTFQRVSEVLHSFSHAYHSLSDLILRVRSPPPRRLVCRPILIQQTAVVPAAFPIQVEAQINFSADSPPATGTASTTSGTQTPTQTSSENARPGTTNSSTNTTNGNTTNTRPSTHMHIPHIEFMNIPGLPQGAVHVQSIPIGVRTVRTFGRTNPTPPAANPNPNPVNPEPAAAATNQSFPNSTTTNPTSNSSNAQGNNPQSQSFNNPNVEFFMEVTPGSITINSLELGNNQAEGGTRGTAASAAAPSQEFIQSIMQMAGHFVNRGASTSNITVNPFAEATQTPPQTTQTTPTAGQGSAPGQNSQARGNTQTHPTTATHTRSTARPHVHFAQHAIQGFDPFLPCNSHHIMHLRRQGTARNNNATNNNQNQPNNNNVRPQNGNVQGNQMNPVLNLVQGMLSSLQNMYGGRRNGTQTTATPTPPTATTAAVNTTTSVPPAAGNAELNAQLLQRSLLTLPDSLMPHIHLLRTMDLSSRGPTIAQLLQQETDNAEGDHSSDGEGIFSDVVTMFSRHLTLTDLVQLNSGCIEPLMRIRNEIRLFVSERVMEGNATTPRNMERAVNKLLDEMQPLLSHLSQLNVQGDIDLVRSIQMLFRTKLPVLINLATSRRPNALRTLMDQVKLTCRLLGALFIHACGPQGIEDVFNRIITHYMEGLTPDLQQWTQLATRAQLPEFLRNVNIPASTLQPYIVRSVDSVTDGLPSETEGTNEAMEVESGEQLNEEESVANVLGVIEIGDGDDMPSVVIGSESWHGQVPPDWVPIIARDAQRQRRQNQAPLSDGYLSGMPNKRRKVVTNNKPQGSLSHVISESMRRAVSASGLSSVTNVEAVAEEAGADLSIQSAYRDLLRSRVQTSIQDNQDFTAERFPNASLYFSKPQ